MLGKKVVSPDGLKWMHLLLLTELGMLHKIIFSTNIFGFIDPYIPL